MPSLLEPLTLGATEDPEGAGAGLYAARELGRRGLAFLHLSEPDWAGGPELGDDYRRALREAHPDLPRRLAEGLPLNPPRPESFYGGDAEGYTDYPAHGAA